MKDKYRTHHSLDLTVCLAHSPKLGIGGPPQNIQLTVECCHGEFVWGTSSLPKVELMW